MTSRQPAEPFKRIKVDEAKRLIEKEKAPIIDVRTPEEYSGGHVPGAMLIPVDSLYTRIDDLPKNKSLVFICQVGQRSALACEIAAAMGVGEQSQIYNVEGGTEAWIKQGYPVER